ncbi:small GTP-binding protein, putative [Trichomonas vaginalis G3]|uniref:Small GTP-binding protein, putative n=2 Tax=Trichomonas vaginalis TaxID=5722 RepID=A0A8U0WP94_TRIV3|nr:small Rab GTPase RabD4 [Trichomonas vaginalis G3]AAX97496.1 small Rab GTPase RabD4 [Trichomonas vaginalis]EAX92640.1 small GTP-binding protein, putative [Trichomonas vaginalis G3]KAI5535689.1 small Rab GTPase RabD4 [Trichomonas vaginalis G3]|eukprot:XP_001305570.1 small GTP-binding protein [Trichomonas vaginalis G3]
MTDSGNAIKLVLLGDSGVGKTSIVTRYVSGSAPENVNPTIGAAFVTKDVLIDGQNLELLIWDTAGQEVYRGLAPMYYRSALIAFIVYDVTKAESFDSVSYWIRELKTNVEENIVILVCGNKVDLEDKRTVEYQTAQNMATENGALYAEASATNGTGIERMFQVAISTLLKQRTPGPSPQPSVNLQDGKSKKEKGGCC